jgi:hypothetical protein
MKTSASVLSQSVHERFMHGHDHLESAAPGCLYFTRINLNWLF